MLWEPHHSGRGMSSVLSGLNFSDRPCPQRQDLSKKLYYMGGNLRRPCEVKEGGEQVFGDRRDLNLGLGSAT